MSGTLTVTAGALAVAAPATIKWTDALSGYNTIVQQQGTLTAIDATGSGSGWNLTASATPFTDSTGPTGCSSTKPCTLPSAALSMASACHTPVTPTITFPCNLLPPPNGVCAAGSTCTLPKNSVTTPVTVAECGKTSSGTTCTPASVADAAPTSGMGATVLGTLWMLTIPANTHAGTYTSTITLSINTGP
jgi:hypothetical protein